MPRRPRTNDLYRCNYHYTDDRRCAEPQSGPGMAYCRAHERKLERMQQRQSAPPPPPPSPPPTAAMNAFTQFLAAHPLDSATRIAHASQLTMILLASGRITTREFNSFQSGFRHLSKTYKFVANETRQPDLFLKHQAANAEAFSASAADLLPAIAADQAAEAAAHEAAAQAHAEAAAAAAADDEPHPSNTFPTRPPAPPLTIEAYLRNQDAFRAAVAADLADAACPGSSAPPSPPPPHESHAACEGG